MLVISNRRIAREYGCSENYVSRVLLGHVPPSERFRTFLAEFTGRRAEELFPADVDAVAS